MDERPIKLLTVNTNPDRAKKLIGRVVEALSPEYRLQHVDNCQSEPKTYLPGTEVLADHCRYR